MNTNFTNSVNISLKISKVNLGEKNTTFLSLFCKNINSDLGSYFEYNAMDFIQILFLPQINFFLE